MWHSDTLKYNSLFVQQKHKKFGFLIYHKKDTKQTQEPENIIFVHACKVPFWNYSSKADLICKL